MKHTPGPWKVRDIHRVTDSNGQGVALMVTRYSQFEAYANARLIAATPTMADYIKRKAELGDKDAISILETFK